jgi:hypothetical protein
MPLGPSGATRPRRRLPSAALSVAISLTLLAGAVAGCSALGGAAFDPSGPCTTDGRAAGAYPELEALVPDQLAGEPPERLDSGRNCSAANLGTLAGHGIDEVRFAGGLWELGAESGTTLAVFRADGLSAADMGEFYEAGANDGRKTSNIEVRDPTIAGRDAFRLDLVNDGRLQTIVALDGTTAGTVFVVLVSTAARDVSDPAAHETAVTSALEAITPRVEGVAR